MSPKNALLAAAAVAVLGMGVYLFIQVRATPAQAGATHVPTRKATASTEHNPTKVATETPPVAEEPTPGTVKPSWQKAPPLPSQASGAGESGSSDVDDRKVDMKLDTLMELANKHYDSQDFDQATAIAGKVLSKDPNNVRMLRIMVSANCIQGDSVVAQTHYERLPKFDREQMKTRCDRYGVTFKDPP